MILKLIRKSEYGDDIQYIYGKNIQIYTKSYLPEDLSVKEKLSGGNEEFFDARVDKFNFDVADVDGTIIKLMRYDADTKNYDKIDVIMGDTFWDKVFLMNDEGQTIERIF